VGWLVGFIRFF